MDGLAFSREVAALNLGKRLPDGVYAHVETLPYFPAEPLPAVELAGGSAAARPAIRPATSL
jgi:hypothetical protein